MNNMNEDSADILSNSRKSLIVGEFPRVPTRFSISEFILIASGVVAVSFSALFPYERKIVVSVIAIVTILALLLILNRRFLSNYQYSFKLQDNQRKAQLYSRMFGDGYADESINIMRGRAIQYCQDLIDDYKATRRITRNVYYIFQISTIVFSGITPILVLLDRVDINISWIKWLPIIFPAIASIVSSLSTSFPFQEKWLAANATVEMLEAEQEKFILGVTQAYRFSDIAGEAERKLKVQESVEKFVNQVNTIHLKQIQLPSESEVQAPKSPENQAFQQSGDDSVPA